MILDFKRIVFLVLLIKQLSKNRSFIGKLAFNS